MPAAGAREGVRWVKEESTEEGERGRSEHISELSEVV